MAEIGGWGEGRERGRDGGGESVMVYVGGCRSGSRAMGKRGRDGVVGRAPAMVRRIEMGAWVGKE